MRLRVGNEAGKLSGQATFTLQRRDFPDSALPLVDTKRKDTGTKIMKVEPFSSAA